jgi:hypothetical protein
MPIEFFAPLTVYNKLQVISNLLLSTRFTETHPPEVNFSFTPFNCDEVSVKNERRIMQAVLFIVKL